MKCIIIFSLIFSILVFNVFSAYAQQPQLASYREIAQIFIDEKIQNQTTAFITLSTTSPLEMRVPEQLDQKIHNNGNITSVTVTNADTCVLGIKNQACVLVNLSEPSLIGSYDIRKIQSDASAEGDTLIGDINKAFGLSAEFNSVYVNTKGELSGALGTSGAVSGNRTISVVYTMSKSDSKYLYDGLTTILLPNQVRNSGGFVDAAKKMASYSNSIVTFVDKLDRSSYFNAGFFPLNSILQVTLLSNQPLAITNHGGDLVPTVEKNGQNLPADLTKAGWLFDPSSGNHITAVYLFGTTFSASKNDLTLTIGNTKAGVKNPIQLATPTPPKPAITDYTSYVLVGIVAAAGIAIYIFLRKR
ncbi:MAG: hypothetical protein E6L02_02255 [Thaumarchaeota archaeon]|nr:MAG: hypothetical protein E6L02_02255 [Nitrososphaerota archaeon]